jgi:hypothetical protein
MSSDEYKLYMREHVSTYVRGLDSMSARALAQIPWVSRQLTGPPDGALSLRRLLHAFDYRPPHYPGGGPEARGPDYPSPDYPEPKVPDMTPPH